MKNSKLSISHVLLAWLLLATIVTTAVYNQNYFADPDIEESIAFEKEAIDGEKEIDLIIWADICHDAELLSLDRILQTQFHSCESIQSIRTPKKLYILYSQMKNHLG
ncbi:MAG: hypothetical protein ACI83W_000523 [Marinoscillum sp.]